MTVPAVLIMSEPDAVSTVPVGTPVFAAVGKPPVAGGTVAGGTVAGGTVAGGTVVAGAVVAGVVVAGAVVAGVVAGGVVAGVVVVVTVVVVVPLLETTAPVVSSVFPDHTGTLFTIEA